MNILIGITYFYPNISGLSIYAKRLAEGLVKKGHQVTVLTSWHNRNLPRSEIVNKVKIIRCPVHIKIGKGVFMLGLPFQIFLLARKADIVNCHLPQFESFIFAFIGKLLGKKVILTHHTDLSGWKGCFNRFSESTVWAGQLMAAFFCDRIVPYTKDYADHSWFLQKFKKKLTFILPPITIDSPQEEIKTKFKKKIGKTKFVIGFAGRIARQKGIPHLLKSISFLERDLIDFKIVFAGPYKNVIGEKYFEEIKNLVKKNQKRLCFLGDIEENQMASFYSLCDILVLPSDDRLESFGLVQVEAMLNGCPVVASDLPGVRIPIEMTKMGELVEVGNPEKLAKKIFEVLKNKRKYQKSQKEIEKLFNYQKTILDYENLFSKS